MLATRVSRCSNLRHGVKLIAGHNASLWRPVARISDCTQQLSGHGNVRQLHTSNTERRMGYTEDPYRHLYNVEKLKASLPTVSEETAIILEIGKPSRGPLGVFVNVPEKKPKGEELLPYYQMLDDKDAVELVQGVTDALSSLKAEPPVDMELPPSRVLERVDSLGSKRFDFVFLDTTHRNVQDAEVYVREKDGTLRTGSPEEREKLVQQFFAPKNKKAHTPSMLQESVLQHLLKENIHIEALDLITEKRQPHQADYHRVHKQVFENIDNRRIYNIIQGTPYWVNFVEFLIKEKRINSLLGALLANKRMDDAQKLAQVYYAFHPKESGAKLDRGKQQLEAYIESTKLEKLSNLLSSAESKNKKKTNKDSSKKPRVQSKKPE